MRVVSLLPSATEIVADLGLLGSLVGRSHECQWPEGVRSVPVVSASRIDSAALSGRQIDQAVRVAVEKGETPYAVDGDLLASLRPDVILTQDLCKVCAVSGAEIADVGAKVISLGPRTLSEVAESVRYLGRELGVTDRGLAVAGKMMERIDAVRRASQGKCRPRVFVAEWIDPPFACGHWIPEMVEAAGGEEVLGRAGQRSVRTSWDAVRATNPELIVAAPCGFDQERSAREAESIDVRCPVVAVDADRYFVRPAPSLAHGVEILARIFHGVEEGSGGHIGWSLRRPVSLSLG
jgi:iron complex transport system substrate-binding protein